MTVSQAIAREPPASRRWRWLAPLLVALGMALLLIAPGVLVDHRASDDARPITEGALTQGARTAQVR